MRRVEVGEVRQGRVGVFWDKKVGEMKGVGVRKIRGGKSQRIKEKCWRGSR